MRVYLDIETATHPVVLGKLAAEDADLDKADADAVEAWTAEHATDRALDPIGGRVTCWAVAVDEGDPDCWVRVDEEAGEIDLLQRLLRCLDHTGAHQIVMHGGSTFDAPFLRARGLAHKLPSLARWMWQDKPWEEKIVDTALPSWSPRPMRSVKGWGYSLDTLAELLGIERASTIPGADCPAAWYAGDHELLAAHCRDDVLTLRAVYHRLAAGRTP